MKSFLPRVLILVTLFWFLPGSKVMAQELEIAGLTFNDANLQACVTDKATAKGWTYISEMTSLTCYNKNIADATGIEALTGLTYLNLKKNQLTGFPASSLTNLTYLKLYDNQLTSIDVSPW